MGRAADAPHPASFGEDESADAVPFIPYCSSPFPKRPREVICEMLGFGLKVAVASHNSLGSSLTGALFVKKTRALLNVCRQGHLRPHLEEALDQNLVRQDGEFITPIQLYTWGRKVCDKTYSENVKKRKRSTQMAVAAPTGFNAQEVALIKLHEEVKSLWKARQSRITAQRDQMISDMQRQLHDMLQARRDEELRALEAAWDPVSRFPEMKESDMLTRCFQKLEHQPGQERPFHRTDKRVLEAKALYEETVQHEALLAYYRGDDYEAKARGLSKLCRREVDVFSAIVGQRGRFTHLLAEANLPADATVLQTAK